MESATHTPFDRDDWAALRSSVPLPLAEPELARLRGTGEPMPMREVEEIYLPLTRLINLHFQAARRMTAVTDEFVGRMAARRPYVVAIAGSVAVGKSTIARLLQTLLARWPDHPNIALVTTDGFLHPRAHLLAEGLLRRKGFPESYDLGRMIRFLVDARRTGQAACPVYSHESYDIVPGETLTIDRPDILIVEGLNVLNIGSGSGDDPAPAFTANDFFDFSIYVDAEQDDIERWYLDRFMLLKKTAFRKPTSYFHHLADVPDEETLTFARGLWNDINLPNLRQNIQPTRSRAGVVIHKHASHAADRLWLRRF